MRLTVRRSLAEGAFPLRLRSVRTRVLTIADHSGAVDRSRVGVEGRMSMSPAGRRIYAVQVLGKRLIAVDVE
jgi:hypothetical protein